MYLGPVPPHYGFHQCSRYSWDPRFGRANGHSTCFTLRIEGNWYYSHSPSDPSVLIIIGAILRSEDCQPEQQPAHHNDHWRSHDQLLSIGGGHLHFNDIPIWSIDVCVSRHERQYLAIERRIRTLVDLWGPGWSCRWRYPDSHVGQSVQYDRSVW